MSDWADDEEVTQQTSLNVTDLHAELDTELNPKRHPLHKFFKFVSFVVGVSAFLMMIGQFVGIAFESVGPIQYVLRVYVIMLCMLTILNELEWSTFTTSSKLLNLWVTRGVIYAFIGVLGLEENDVSPESKNMSYATRTVALNFIKAVAWMMISCGVLYFVMGVFCLQLAEKKMRESYETRVERSKDTARITQRFGGIVP